MLNNLDDVKQAISLAGIEYFRNDAPKNQKYPYLIYEYIGDINVNASNKIIRELQEYQLSYITVGIESELDELKKIFKKNNIFFSSFKGLAYDENDLKVKQFVSYVRCLNERWI